MKLGVPLFLFIVFSLSVTAQQSGQNNRNQWLNSGNKSLNKTVPSIAKVNGDVGCSKNEDPAKEWLESLFRCRQISATCYCYYIDQEDKICTDQFKAFLEDANAVYGASNLDEHEFLEAEAAYKRKWATIYPLYTQETWLFGRGNDDAIAIKDVVVSKKSRNRYRIFIDYGADIKTLNEVNLIVINGSYKIDYCHTTFVHEPAGQ